MNKKQKRVKEIKRKAIHISSMIIPLSFRYLAGYSRKMMILALFPLAIISIVIELLRMEHLTSKSLFHRFFGSLLRTHEKTYISGASFLVVSSIFTIALLPNDIAFCALSFLAIGDTIAAIVGINLGKRKLSFVNKSVEGSLACFVATFIFALFYVHPFVAFCGAVSATIAELSPLRLDDNIKIPFFSGIVMWGAELLVEPLAQFASILKIYLTFILQVVGIW